MTAETQQAVSEARGRVLNDAQNYPGFRELVDAFEAAVRADERRADDGEGGRMAEPASSWQDWPTTIGWHETAEGTRILVKAIIDGGFSWGWDEADDPEYVPRDSYEWQGQRFRRLTLKLETGAPL